MGFLTIDNVSHNFFSKSGYTKALEDISFTVKRNEFISLLGPSGCGKSTILSLIAGILSPTEGNISYNGESISHSRPSTGYMLQQDYLFPWKTIIENVMIGPKLRKEKTDETYDTAIRMLEEVNLHNIADHYPDALSGGMRQRVALVRTLITDPEILLLDEPFSSLDYLTKLKLEDLISDLLTIYQKTSILVTHDIAEAISLSDRIILLDTDPGMIAETFEVPVELRDEKPFNVRKHPKYQKLFDKIWGAFNDTNTFQPVQKGGEENR